MRLFLVVLETAITLLQKGMKTRQTLLNTIYEISLKPTSECSVKITVFPSRAPKNMNSRAKGDEVWWQWTTWMSSSMSIFLAAG